MAVKSVLKLKIVSKKYSQGVVTRWPREDQVNSKLILTII
jgi:hypothetical protein